MNKLCKYSMIVLAAFAMVGCTGMEQYPLDAISPETFFNTGNDLQLYTNSFYNMLPSAGGVYNEAIDNVVKQDLADELQGGSRRLVPADGLGVTYVTSIFIFKTLRSVKMKTLVPVMMQWLVFSVLTSISIW